ncbi:Uncharacterised protein [Legionella steigerwaltii]|uniref:Uncharacterized protein n=1 Tax=Legionella steigerwaltii TaxID=460 RepID=A0A378LA85_9GAMM|nr:hypothetical protein [Legionella steigerwaltii]KTD75366.1 hypothetical protein Lstg_2541 [Legionella steigerwaltii]STY23723.1 Uncharacterised protein [Legionella steigerwaltii]
MKVGEFKEKIDEVRRNVDSLKAPVEAIDLVTQLSKLFEPLEDQIDVRPDMIPPVKELINQFWSRVIHTIPWDQSDQWHTAAFVMPWLALQRFLGKARLLEADFHYSILYESLAVPGNPLRITMLMPLFICASRMLSYAAVEELENYPFLKLKQKIVANKRQEIEKLKDIIFLLRSIFYLMYKHCTLEQIALMPSLIYFRYPTTDEERRSELAIFNWLTKHPIECTKFFNTYDDYINMHSIEEIDALGNVANLLPTGCTGRKNFLRATNESRWIYLFIHQVRNNPDFLEDKDAAIEETLRLLRQDFNEQKNKSLTAVWDFTLSVKMFERVLSAEEAKIVHSAIYAFCMEKYMEQFDLGDDHPQSSFLHSEWESWKCQAAEKRKLAAVYGKSVKLGFFETLAANQGRLKKLIDFLEESRTSDLENYKTYRLNIPLKN